HDHDSRANAACLATASVAHRDDGIFERVAMAEPIKIPAGFHRNEPQWLAQLVKEELVYFLLNVGDADAQVLLLPEVDEPGHPHHGKRQAIVVDAALRGKVPSLLTALATKGLLPRDPSAPPESVKLGADSIALVAASHPHQD